MYQNATIRRSPRSLIFCSPYTPLSRGGNKCRFWQIFVEALEEFPILIVQSKASVSTHEYSEIMKTGQVAKQLRGRTPRAQTRFVINWYLFLPLVKKPVHRLEALGTRDWCQVSPLVYPEFTDR